MAKKIRSISIIIIFVILIASFSLLAKEDAVFIPDNIDNFPYIEDNLLASSRFTNKEVVSEDKYQEYINEYTLKYTETEIDELGYVKQGETDELILYFESTSFSILIRNKLTGYLWSSNAEFLTSEEKGKDYRTGIWIDYVMTQNVSRNFLTENFLNEKAKVTLTKLTTKEGFSSLIYFDSLGFKFEVIVYIEDGDLVVEIPSDKIQELLPRYSLINIQVFPYLGSARLNKVPGYLFIPDGIGALIRFNEEVNGNYYLSSFYGSDFGYANSFSSRHPLSLPIFGVVHDVDNNAFLSIIESGSTISDLGAYFLGYRNSNYYRINPIFKFREFYINIIDKKGNGSDAIQEGFNQVNVKVRYKFLSGDDASYTGMALTYKKYLEEQGKLEKLNTHGDIPLAIDFIMSELEDGLLGQTSVHMTKAPDLLDIYNELKVAGVNNQLVNILGWSKSGLIDTAPYKVKYSSSKKDYVNMINTIKEDGNEVYFFVNYVVSSIYANRPRNSDLARRISKVKMEFNDGVNFLYPDASLDFAKSDKKSFEKLGIDNLFFDSLGNILFSYYQNNNRFNREDSIRYYLEIAKTYGKSAFDRPNAYMFEYVEKYMNMPLYNSQHDYFSDLVPFLPILLKGNIEYYSPYLNFNSLGKEQVLNLVDYGMYPNFVVTKENTTKLLHTKSNIFFSTKYTDFKDKIIDQYHYINAALKHVNSASIIDREVIDTGIVKTSYSNGVEIFINYTSNNYSYNGLIILAKDYYVYEK